MSKLKEFLTANPVDNLTQEIVLSERLKDFKVKIKAMTSEQYGEYTKRATKTSGGRKNLKVTIDTATFNNLIAINHTVEPDFRDAAWVKENGCNTPEQLLNRVLNAGEIAELTEQIQTLSGFNKSFEDEIEDAKN